MAMTDKWDFYFCTIEERPASIALDLGAAEAGPDPTRPFLLCVRLAMLRPRPDGLSSSEEAPELNALEKRLDEALTAACGAEQVGRLTWNGVRELFYYGRSDEEIERALRVATEGSPDREVQWRHEHDPEWTFYRDFLYPSPGQMQWILDRRVVDQLRSHGDSLEVPRPVDHYVNFTDRAARDEFLKLAVERGFEGRTSDVEDEAAPRFCAHLVREDPVDLSHIHEVVLELRALADEHGGEYDGWGCPVQQA